MVHCCPRPHPQRVSPSPTSRRRSACRPLQTISHHPHKCASQQFTSFKRHRTDLRPILSTYTRDPPASQLTPLYFPLPLLRIRRRYCTSASAAVRQLCRASHLLVWTGFHTQTVSHLFRVCNIHSPSHQRHHRANDIIFSLTFEFNVHTQAHTFALPIKQQNPC